MILNQNAAASIRRHSSRRGITILEIMVVMTGVAAMLALCALTIQLLMRLNDDRIHCVRTLGLQDAALAGSKVLSITLPLR